MAATIYAHGLKPLLDRTTGLLGLVLLSPLLLGIALLLALCEGPPAVWFVQRRIGFRGRAFRLYKFQTLRTRRDAEGLLLPDAARRFALGQWLRRYSLDELPQLLNLLNGSLSLIGPRPLLPEYMPWYSPHEQLRHSVRPGLIGPAQLQGRNQLDWPTRLALDVRYAERITLGGDLCLCLQGLRLLLRGELATGHLEAERFDHWCQRMRPGLGSAKPSA